MATPEAETSGRQQRITWTPEMKKALIYEMLEQVRAGKRAESGFKNEAWIAIVPLINAVAPEGSVEVTVQRAKSKMTIIKEEYKLWKFLWSQSGWSLHPVTRMIMTTDENWEVAIKVRKEAAYFRTHALQYQEELMELLGDTGATGCLSQTTSQLRSNDSQDDTPIDPMLSQVTVTAVADEDTLGGNNGGNSGGQPSSDSGSQGKSQGSGRSTPMLKVFQSISDALVQGLQRGESKSERATAVLMKDYKEQDED